MEQSSPAAPRPRICIQCQQPIEPGQDSVTYGGVDNDQYFRLYTVSYHEGCMPAKVRLVHEDVMHSVYGPLTGSPDHVQ